MTSTMNFNIGDRVRITHKYPADRDYPIPHELDTALWGCLGTVVSSEDGYTDDAYVFVLPVGVFNSDWPRKERFDPLPYWHFLPEELERV